jgi:hypothetical protein
MNYAVRIEFEDGSSQPHSEHWSISDSAAEALRLADQMGLDGTRVVRDGSASIPMAN